MAHVATLTMAPGRAETGETELENVKRFGVVVVAGGLCYFGAAFANQAHALMLALIVLVQHERYSTWILAGLLVIALEWREMVREARR